MLARTMSIRARHEDAQILARQGRLDGALLMLLIAVAATAKKRFPGLLDSDGFQAFVKVGVQEVTPIKVGGGFSVTYRGESVMIERIFYKFMRCTLVHEARLPADLEVIVEPTPGMTSIRVEADKLVMGLGWLDNLFEMVVRAPENAEQFADVLAKPEAGPPPR